MAKAYSHDLRERVVAAALAGQPCRAVAATFKVSSSNVVKWVQLTRDTSCWIPDTLRSGKRLSRSKMTNSRSPHPHAGQRHDQTGPTMSPPSDPA